MDNQSGPLLATTASVIAGELCTTDPLARQATVLARSLKYSDSSVSERASAVALLRAGARFKRVFQLHSPEAPGLVVFGGEADPAVLSLDQFEGDVANLAGCGLSLREALEPCLGEGIEYLSQLEWGDEVLVEGTASTVDHGHEQASLDSLLARLSIDHSDCPQPHLDWCKGRRLSDNALVLLPADLCLRRSSTRRGAAPTAPLSIGAAAGRTLEEAILAGLLEIVERDAVALWWCGGQRGRSLPLEFLARSQTDRLIAQLRGDACRRRTWLMDVTSDLGIPVIVAMSADAQGRKFVCGMAARLDPAEAVRDAVLEACQMELSYHLIEMKRRERSEAAFNDGDWRHLERDKLIDAKRCNHLYPVGSANFSGQPSPQDVGTKVRYVVDRLQRAGFEAFYVDMTRANLGVPAAWVCATGLQPAPSDVATPRLKYYRAKNPTSSPGDSIPLF